MKKLEIKDIGLNLNLLPFTNIIGLPGSGKTTILKMLINQVYNPNVYLDDKRLTDYDIWFLKHNIAVCLNDFNFKTAYVKEELLYYQDKLGIDRNISFANIEKFAKFFNIAELLDSPIIYLTIYEKAFIKILSLLIINPTILGIDDLMTYLDNSLKLKIIKYAKENKINIINITTDKEELLLGEYVVIIEKFKVIAYDKVATILNDEKLLTSAGMKPPFIAELSTGLNYYDLLKKKYFDSKSLVGAIWK